MRKPPAIQTLESRVAYENRWMKVREDTIRSGDGSFGIYGFVDKPDFVIILPIGDGMVHLVEQYRYPIRRRQWELPQGSSMRMQMRASRIRPAASCRRKPA